MGAKVFYKDFNLEILDEVKNITNKKWLFKQSCYTLDSELIAKINNQIAYRKYYIDKNTGREYANNKCIGYFLIGAMPQTKEDIIRTFAFRLINEIQAIYKDLKNEYDFETSK